MDCLEKFYDKMIDSIIRPPRERYSLRNLGDNFFTYEGYSYVRQDFTLHNYRGQSIQCSYFKRSNNNKIRPLIIYLHGNSSSRYTSLNNTRNFLKSFDICLFDCTGSGLSEGNYVTVGYHQKQDLKQVIKYLKHVKKIPVIFLWGRSMGSIVSILYTGKYGEIQQLKVDGIVLDSPFYDFEVLLNQIAKSHFTLPNFLVKYFISKIAQKVTMRIKQEYGFEFSIYKLKPIQEMKKIKVPVFILAAQGDQVIQYLHSKALYENCIAQEKHLLIFQGDHNSNRPIDIVSTVLSTFKMIGSAKIMQLKKKEEQKLKIIEQQKLKIIEEQKQKIQKNVSILQMIQKQKLDKEPTQQYIQTTRQYTFQDNQLLGFNHYNQQFHQNSSGKPSFE